MSTNNKISSLINSQVPFFVKNDHQNFVRFIEAYYEFLEQNGGEIDRAKNLRSYQDIDRSLGEFEQKLYDTYLKLIPENVIVDKRLLLKHIKDFYQARGTEKSIRFLMAIMFGEQAVDFYYPKKDVLRASDGKWFIQKSLRVNETVIDGTSNNTIAGLNRFVGRTVKGNTSNATATVERVDRFLEKGTQIDELIISGIIGSFVNGEQVFSLYEEEGGLKSITSNVFGGILTSVTLTNPGSGYLVGTHPIVEGGGGTGANVRIDAVSSGNISSITVIEGGAGYQNNIFALFSGGGGGTGANAQVISISTDESVHPNSYNIAFSTISLEANTAINNTRYSNLNSSIVPLPNANTRLVDAFQFFRYGNTGPIRLIAVNSPGGGFSSLPSISFLANTRISELQILGRMEIVSGGVGYQIGDVINITNSPGGYGFGAAANVTNVNAAGSITQVKFVPVAGQITGGSGYNILPTANVVSGNASAYGAEILVTQRLGEGGQFILANTTLGAIQRISITDRGLGYTSAPTINLRSLGDGTATAVATAIEGVFTYPGRYLNDDGFLSSYNFLQDRDYYQEFSYVLRLRQSISKYRKALKDLIHPAGMKLFGTYLIEDNNKDYDVTIQAEDSLNFIKLTKPYQKVGNTVNVSYTSHTLSPGNTVYLEFLDGGFSNVKNGIYNVVSTTANNFIVTQPKSAVNSVVILTSGFGYNSNSFIVFSAENDLRANARYTINANGAIVSVDITDFGKYYSSIPTATANGSNTTPATFAVRLDHYANNTNGNVIVSFVV